MTRNRYYHAAEHFRDITRLAFDGIAEDVRRNSVRLRNLGARLQCKRRGRDQMRLYPRKPRIVRVDGFARAARQEFCRGLRQVDAVAPGDCQRVGAGRGVADGRAGCDVDGIVARHVRDQ